MHTCQFHRLAVALLMLVGLAFIVVAAASAWGLDFIAWIAVAAAWPAIEPASAIALGFGVGVGSAAYFALLAHWIATLPRDGRVARVVPIVASVLLVAIALAGLARAFC